MASPTAPTDCGGMVRAAVLADVLAHLDRASPGVRRRVEAALSSRAREALAETSRMGWLPVEIDVELTERLLSHFGRSALRRFSAGATLAALEVPLLGGPARLARAGLRPGPSTVFRAFAVGWKLSYRRMGVVAYRASPSDGGTLVFEGLPGVVLASEAMRLAFEGMVDAAVEHARTPLRVGEGRVSLAARNLEIEVRR
ncbi:MAG TPA: hypothetical protein RMH99_01490 [Sandaracinaceae bacterium LLY-WYZ-13_1]|nr:hypothetical protein [Sandaracinaceae bacterium LLY-WYZ-13_1]